MSTPHRSKYADMPYAEAVLVDVLRLALGGRAEELPARLRSVVDPPRRGKGARLSEHGRAALATLLAEPVEPPADHHGLRTATIEGPARTPENATLPESVERSTDADEPVLDATARNALDRVVREHGARERLQASGLRPTRTVLLSGPPGVGKSMTISYLAAALGRPLVRLEPSHVIGSLLGESSRMLSAAFASAKAASAMLALDEIDALAKRRDDPHDVGEFKRFVSTLLVELDRWPADVPLIAATNHLELLDPALERRFELHVRLAPPGPGERREIVQRRLASLAFAPSAATVEALVAITAGASGAGLDVLVDRAARSAVLDDEPLDRALLVAAAPGRDVDRAARERFAAAARNVAGLTTRQVGMLLDCSHTAARRMALAGAANPAAVVE